MKSEIVKLGQVIELKSDYLTPARQYVGQIFKLTRVIIGEKAILERVNTKDFLGTSKVKSIEIVEDLISITTENTIYHFEVL